MTGLLVALSLVAAVLIVTIAALVWPTRRKKLVVTLTIDGRAIAHSLCRSLQIPTPTKENTMSLLDTIEARFRSIPKLFSGEIDDAEKLAHSTIAQKAEAFVKDVLPLLPDGSAAEEFVKRVQEGVAWAHSAVSNAEKPAETAVADATSAVDSAEAAVASPGETAAPEAAPTTEVAAPAATAETTTDAAAPAAGSWPAADAATPAPGSPAA